MTMVRSVQRWHHVVYHHVGRVRKTSSRGPDQQLQRRQRVYRQLGVQQALILVQ